ncbi:MAG: S8 family serine peptidase [Porphyromonadaceae bacterium]|nr:S8 family serine peptidase [Porphyromonadaceae bacterium]
MRNLFILILLFFSLHSFGRSYSQSLSYKFRVYLKDKGATTYTLDKPEQFLSKEAIERKKGQHVTIDKTDFPISADYFKLIEKAGGEVVSHSKWFSTVTVQVADSLAINGVLSLPFVDTVKYVWRGNEWKNSLQLRPRLGKSDCGQSVSSAHPFGLTVNQFVMHNADKLLLAGFQGKGIDVGVIDAGFTNFDVIPWFKTVDLQGFINFVPEGEMFATSDHGTKVLSTMAVNQPGLMMGSAPEAAYWLLRSEDVRSEFPVEEDYWVRAIEYADSLGLDLINTSLGYSEFDDKNLNYNSSDLTGEVSFMSRAANMAYEKGMLIVVSAGNEGNKPWQKTTPPGDAKNVLAVGAVGTDSLIASFSSHGLMEDGRIKPDLVSVGIGTVTIGEEGQIGYTNGTSLSSPFLAGLIASLWSVNPDMQRGELIDIIKRSSDRYLMPDSLYGNGIADFQKAYGEVLARLHVEDGSVEEQYFSVSRSSKNHFLISLTQPEFSYDDYELRLLDESGQLISTHTFEKEILQISVPRSSGKTAKFVHLLFKSPYQQKILRFPL